MLYFLSSSRWSVVSENDDCVYVWNCDESIAASEPEEQDCSGGETFCINVTAYDLDDVSPEPEEWKCSGDEKFCITEEIACDLEDESSSAQSPQTRAHSY